MKVASPRRLLSVLSMFALLLLIVACGSPAAPDTEESAADGETSSETSSGDTVTLQAWVFAGEEGFLTELIDEFHTQYPNIRVELTDIPEGEYVTKIDTALLANEPPDIGFIYERRWLKAGAFLPIGEQLASAGINVDDYGQGALGACMYEGEVYCLGTYVGAVLLFYNKDLFDVAGIPYPSATEPMTIDEFSTIANQLSNHAEDINERVWGADAGLPYWWADQLTMFSDDLRTVDGQINDPDTAHFYQVLADMRNSGASLSSSETDLLAGGGADLFAQSKLATTITDNAVAIPAAEQAGLRWGAAPLPVEAEGDRVYLPTWTDSFGIFAGSDNPEEAMTLLTFLIENGNQRQLDLGNLPLDLTLAAENGYAEGSEGRQNVMDAIALTSPTQYVPGFWDVLAPIDDTFEIIAEEGQPAQDALNEAAPIMQESLDLNWETWESIE